MSPEKIQDQEKNPCLFLCSRHDQVSTPDFCNEVSDKMPFKALGHI